jgi:hypothetical protein
LSSTHSYSVTTPADCRDTGTETCACGYSRTIARSSSHTGPITSTDSSTCTTAGSIVYTCRWCGNQTGVLMGDALGHSFASNGKCSRPGCGAACSHS